MNTIFWFRQDLRLKDNPGLCAAAKKGQVLPVYIIDNNSLAKVNQLGGASNWWLYHSLAELNSSLDNKLNLFIGCPDEIMQYLVHEYNIQAVYWNRCYDPHRIQTDTNLKSQLVKSSVTCQSFNASLLWEPWQVLKKDGTPYKVFTPYYRKGCLNAQPPELPLAKPRKLNLKAKLKKSDFTNSHDFTLTSLKDSGLLPKIKWYNGLTQRWQPGEEHAHKRLKQFLKKGLMGYKEGRNFPAANNVSRLSAPLHFGEISPRQVWHAVQTVMAESNSIHNDADCFLSELGWREFSHSLLYHFPTIQTKSFQAKFDEFKWGYNKKLLTEWQQGITGYPIIDAGMRELWQTGYMHNRVRMVVASFLVKNLLIHWQHGERWFRDCLVDADLANNTAGWQWVAGSGADAAPYFRIFNPITQGEKFDPQGDYTKKYVPELARLPAKYLYKPWEAPVEVLDKANVTLGIDYPKPIIDIKASRKQALAVYKDLQNIIK